MSKLDSLGEQIGKNAQNVVFLIGAALLLTHKKLIDNPDSISKQQLIFTATVTNIAKNFRKKSKKWADTDLIAAYLLGLNFADTQNRKLNNNKAINKITNGTFLFKNLPIISPELTTAIKSKFKSYPAHLDIIGLIRSQAYGYIDKQSFQILRKSNDIYRRIAIEVGTTAYKQGNYFTRLNLSQQLLNEYSRQGLTTITYSNGAVHSIDNYCELLGRTMTNNAFRQANLNRYQETGYQLGQVSSHFRACDLCTPYEGEILSLDGRSRDYPSLYDAETAGLFHVNCKHSISPYVEGGPKITGVSVDAAEQSLINEYGYNEAQKMAYSAQQQQRYNERQIRKYKRLTATSIESRNKNKYNNKIKEWQARQRELINNNTYLKRKYSREQIERAH